MGSLNKVQSPGQHDQRAGVPPFTSQYWSRWTEFVGKRIKVHPDSNFKYIIAVILVLII